MSQIPKTTSHVRSKSLPTGSHPVIVNVEDHLCRLKAQVESTSSSSSSICSTLDGLKKLYECVNDMLQLPLTQQSLSHNGSTEEILEGSLGLLDVCATVKDVLSQMKGSVQNLESCIRRKRHDITNDVSSYLVLKKKINKMVSKCIRSLPSSVKTFPTSILEKDNINPVAVVSLFREVEAISFSTMKTLLCYVSGTRATSKNRWSLVSKVMMQPKRVPCKTEEGTDISQLEMVDSLLGSLSKHQLSKDVNMVQNVMKQLEISELAMCELEDGIESVFRCLMKTRVSLLNMLSH